MILTALGFRHGDQSKIISQSRPDIAYYEVAVKSGTSPNRSPGVIKPSWKWNTPMAASPVAKTRKEYRQALSQVNWYMNQHNARYGFLLTNRELVAIRRLDENGNLPIPYTRGGTAEHSELTVLLALWYLGMLAANDQGPNRWTL